MRAPGKPRAAKWPRPLSPFDKCVRCAENFQRHAIDLGNAVVSRVGARGGESRRGRPLCAVR